MGSKRENFGITRGFTRPRIASARSGELFVLANKGVVFSNLVAFISVLSSVVSLIYCACSAEPGF